MEEVTKGTEEPRKLNFLEEIIESDLASGKYDSIMTRSRLNRTDICISGMRRVYASISDWQGNTAERPISVSTTPILSRRIPNMWIP